MRFAEVLDHLDKVGSVVSAACAVLGFFGVALTVRRVRGTRHAPRLFGPTRSPAPAVQRLLRAQRVAAEQSTYEPWHIGQPLIGDIYVEQQAEAIGPDYPAAEPTLFDVHEMLTRFRDVVVVGGPGTGKSTLAKNLVRESVRFWLTEGRRTRAVTPPCRTVTLQVPAARLAQVEADTMAEALTGYFTTHQYPLDGSTFRRRPARGADWLIVIDGFDEILSPSTRSRLLALIRHELVAVNRVMRFVITSRSPLDANAARGEQGGAAEVRLCVFDEGRLQLFAARWFGSRGNPDASAEARRFLTRFSVGPLANLVRVPLMAAMAAVIHEFDGAEQLPTSRTELYGQFVDVLRRSRGPLPAAPGIVPVEAATWLAANLDRLLTVAAREAVQCGPGGMLASVVACCTRTSPERIRTWLGSTAGRFVVRDHLLATSLVTMESTNLVFVHHSVAEYLASTEQSVDLPHWLSQLGDPDRRSFALFCVARAGLGEAAIRALLDQRPTDPVRTGHLLLDGTAVDQPTRQQVVADLGAWLMSENEAADEALAILASLAVVDEAVAGRLFAWADSSATPAWARALLSDKIANFDPRRGERLLIKLAVDRGRLLRHACRRWAAYRLISRGNKMGQHILDGLDFWAGPVGPSSESAGLTDARTSLKAVADRQVAADGRQTLAVRAEAALQLMSDGHHDDPVLHDVLRRVCRDRGASADVRRKAAATIVQLGGPEGDRAIHDLLRDASIPQDAVAAVVQMMSERSDGETAEALQAAVQDDDVPLSTRQTILAQAQQNGDFLLSQQIALDNAAQGNLRTDAVRFFKDRGGGHGVMHAVCTDRSAPPEARAIAIVSLTEGSCRADLGLLRQVATDPREDHVLRLHAAKGLVERGDPDAGTVLREVARRRLGDSWLRRNALALLAIAQRAVPVAVAPSGAATGVPIPGNGGVVSFAGVPASGNAVAVPGEPTANRMPEPRNAVGTDPQQLRRLITGGRAVSLDRRKEAAAGLLPGADAPMMDWLIEIGWSGTEYAWLRELVVAELLTRRDPASLDRCRAMVADSPFGGALGERLAIHLVNYGTRADLTLVRPLVRSPWVDGRVCEIIVLGLLERRDPEDVEVLVDVAGSPPDSRITRLILQKLMFHGEHEAVRKLWPRLSSARCADSTRLAIGETLAYSGTAADHDELRRLISNVASPPHLRLRLAEILSHRGDETGRAVLRNLTCDDTLKTEIRGAALALIAVPREAADANAIRRVACDPGAPSDLRESAMRCLGNIGSAGELSVIRTIGFDASNAVLLRRRAGEMLAQLGDESGLAILDQLGRRGPSVVTVPGRWASASPGRRGGPPSRPRS